MSKSADNPYPGSRAFQQADHDHFHGRGADAATVIDLWTTRRLTILTGPVASGKTSLLHAGVYPLMPGKRSELLLADSLSGGMTFPFAALPEHNPYTLALLRSWAPDDVPTRLAGLTVSDFLCQRASRDDYPVFAAIDRMDDLEVDPPSGSRRVWRRQFLAELAQACADHPRLHLLLCARSEAFDTISTTVGAGTRYELPPLTLHGVVEAITKPAESVKHPFSDGAVERLVFDLRHSHITTAYGERYLSADTVEPSLLQAACTQLWRALPPDAGEISEWTVRAFSDVDTALATHCATMIMQVAAEHDLSPNRLRSWMLDIFVTDEGAPRSVPEGVLATAQMPNAVVRGLVDRHLLSSEATPPARRYQLLAERLIEPLRHATFSRPAVPTTADYIRAAELSLSLGDVDLARRHAMRALGTKPGWRAQADAESLLGNVAHEQGKPPDALPHYQKAASLLEAAGDTSAASRALAAVGQTFLTLGDTYEAVTEFRTAVERVPSDLVLQTQLALALWQQGNNRTAVAILDDVLRIDGGDPEALRARGEILADLGDARSAMRDLMHPSLGERPSTQAARGLVLAELGDFSEATKVITGAVEAARRDGRVLLYAARAFAKAGDTESSGELARDALDATDPPLSPTHRRLAQELAGHVLDDLPGLIPAVTELVYPLR